MARILIVDDSYIIRYRLREILTKAGHNIVAEAENGIQAISRVYEFNPELITMDITMPQMDGIAALKKIQTINPNIKVVMLSAMGQKLIVLEAIKSGAAHFIVKPFDDSKVVQIIKEVVDLEINIIKQAQDENSKNVKEAKDNANSINFTNIKEKSFEIVNINDTFIIKILCTPSEEEINHFCLALNDLVMTCVINTIFDFHNLEYLDPKFMEIVSETIKKIVDHKGTFLLASTNKKFIDFVKSLGLIHLTEFVNVY